MWSSPMEWETAMWSKVLDLVRLSTQRFQQHCSTAQCSLSLFLYMINYFMHPPNSFVLLNSFDCKTRTSDSTRHPLTGPKYRVCIFEHNPWCSSHRLHIPCKWNTLICNIKCFRVHSTLGFTFYVRYQLIGRAKPFVTLFVTYFHINVANLYYYFFAHCS